MSIDKIGISKFGTEKNSFSIQEMAALESFNQDLVKKRPKMQKLRKKSKSFLTNYTYNGLLFELFEKCLGHDVDKIHSADFEPSYEYNSYTEEVESSYSFYFEFHINICGKVFKVYFEEYQGKVIGEYKLGSPKDMYMVFNGESLFIIEDKVTQIHLQNMLYSDIKNLYKLHINSSHWREVLKDDIEEIQKDIPKIREVLESKKLSDDSASKYVDLRDLRNIVAVNYAIREAERKRFIIQLNSTLNPYKKDRIKSKIEANDYAVYMASRYTLNKIIDEIYKNGKVENVKKTFKRNWFKVFNTTYLAYVSGTKIPYKPITTLGGMFLEEDLKVNFKWSIWD